MTDQEINDALGIYDEDGKVDINAMMAKEMELKRKKWIKIFWIGLGVSIVVSGIFAVLHMMTLALIFGIGIGIVGCLLVGPWILTFVLRVKSQPMLCPKCHDSKVFLDKKERGFECKNCGHRWIQ